MPSYLYQGQHPRYAVPDFSFPLYARVGAIIVGGADSGMKRLYKVMLVQDAEQQMLNRRLMEDKELRELLEIILISGALE